MAAPHSEKLNIELTKFFPQHTLEGVKGMRRNAKYKSLLSSLQAPSAALPGPSPSMAVALRSASPTRPSCNLEQSDVSWAAPDDGDFNLHFNPHERNRFDSWRESLLQELVLNQGYFYDIDIIQIMDCQVGQLTHNQKSLIDKEYRNWMEGEVIASPHRKGANRRSRRREARQEKAAGLAAAGGR